MSREIKFNSLNELILIFQAEKEDFLYNVENNYMYEKSEIITEHYNKICNVIDSLVLLERSFSFSEEIKGHSSKF